MSKHVCIVCENVEDAVGSIWVKCDFCNQWYHIRCVNLPAAPSNEEVWLCAACAVQTNKINSLSEETKSLKEMNLLLMQRLENLKKAHKDNEEENFGGFSGHRNNRTPSNNQLDGMDSLIALQKQLISRQHLQELMTFSGDPDDWPLFYSQYVETTELGNLDDAFDICRLRRALKGEALRVVKGALYLPNNLSEVMKILETRFGN
jgi:hypothetical protein